MSHGVKRRKFCPDNKMIRAFAWSLVIALSLLRAPARGGERKLVWEHDDSAAVAGFRVYYGTASRSYAHMVDVGVRTSWPLQDLNPGQTYYFAVTAYAADGSESSYSAELSYTVPLPDRDSDGLSDQLEQNRYHTDYLKADTDGDGLSDGDEVNYWHDRWAQDSDGDGVINLLDPDSDNDGYSDGVEVEQGFDPADAGSHPGPRLTTTVYEDAEDGTTDGWLIYDGDADGATFSNLYDQERGSRVIQLSGNALADGFMLIYPGLRVWHNAWEPVIQWSMKAKGDFIVYVDIDTTAGHRYLYYTPTDHNDLGSGEYVHHGIGSDTRLGEWYTFVRDLQADLQQAQPDAVILEVNGFLVRGSCRLDDIQLHNILPGPVDSDGDGLDDGEETGRYGTDPQQKDTDHDGIGDRYEVRYWGDRWAEDSDGDGTINLLDPDSDNDGHADGEEIGAGTDPADAGSHPASAVTVYEDAGDGSTLRWYVYDDASGTATIKNVYDRGRSSRVIKVIGHNLDDGFCLAKAGKTPWHNTTQRVITWSMKYSGPFTIYVDVETTAGHRYLYYAADDEDRLDEGEYIHHGIGSDSFNGRWKTVTRDLDDDLEEAQPGNRIIEVNGFLVRGTGKIDNVKLMTRWP